MENGCWLSLNVGPVCIVLSSIVLYWWAAGAGSALQTLALVQSPALGSSRQPAAAGGAGAGKVNLSFLLKQNSDIL